MQIITPICGFISFFLGVIVLFGWYTHSPTLIQVHPSFVAMQYNTALGFLICGIGLLAILKSKTRIFRSCGLFLVLLGSLTLIQYIFGLNFGIDQIFMEHYIDQKASHPGRMAPNTALCFLLVGLSFLYTPIKKLEKNSTTSLAILGSLTWALGTVAFAGYAMKLETAYGWGNLTRMAVHTASGFIVMGVGIISHSWNMQLREKTALPPWLPLLAALVSFTVTLLLWQAQSAEQDRGILEQINAAAKNIESELITELEGRINGLERRGKRWERGQIPAREEFSTDINLYIEQHVSVVGALWMDSNLNLQYSTPKDTDTNLITDIEKQKDRMSSMMKARDEIKTVALGGFKLSTDERVLLVHIPVFKNFEFQGLLVGVLQPRRLLAETLSTQIDEGISAEVLGPAELEEEVASGNNIKDRWMVERDVGFMGVSAKLKVRLSKEGLKKKSSFVANAILIVGLLISFLLFLTIRIAQRAKRSAEETIKAHEALKGIQEKLKKNNELLLEGALEGIYGLDLEGRTTFVNHAGAAMIGYTAEELLGKPQHPLIHHTKANGEPYPREECHIYAAFKNGKVHHEENEVFWKKDGTSFPVEYTSRPVREGDKITGAVVTFSDISRRKKTEKALKENEEQFRTLVDNIPGVSYRCLIDKDWTMLYISDAINALSGYPPEDFIHNAVRTFDSINHSEDRKMIAEAVDECIKKKEPFTVEYRIIHADGRILWVAEKGQASFNEKGESLFLDGAIFDITDQKMAEEELRASEEMTRAVIENALDGMIIIDEKGSIISFNPAAENLFGYKKEEALEKNLKFLMGEPYQSEHDEYISNYLTTRIAKIIGMAREVEGLRKNGTVFPMELCVTQVWIKNKLHFSGVIRDITLRKEAEKKINQAREAAESANQAKSMFISSMSHEIRTPMNAILGYSQILERDKGLNEKQKKGVGSIHRAGKHLLDIINDILDFSKIEAGKMELHPQDFDLGSLVQDLVVIFSGKCKDKKLELQTEGVREGQNIFVHADAAKMRQVLVNLMGNAVKFTDSGKVSFRLMPLAGDEFYFEVKDTGQGIPQEKLKSIFGSFQQDEEGFKKGGTGLGLAIASKIVSTMGGELQVESETGKGARFFFTISLSPAQGEVHAIDDRLTRAIGLAQGHSVKAVLIDDIKEDLNVLIETMKEIGAETIDADSGPQGLEKIRAAKPDIVFVDYNMPGMDGLEVTRKIKQEYGEDNIKIVIISASTFAHNQEQYKKEGVHGFIGKPFIREEILGTMARLLNVEFEYEEEDSPAGASGDLDFSMIKLPTELHASIKEMAGMGMMTELEEILPQVESSGPQGPNFAAHLKERLDQFDTDGIISLLEQMENE